MSAQPPTPVRAIAVADNEIARRVLRWLAVAGVIVGTAQLATAILTLVGWGYAGGTVGQSAVLRALYRVAVTLSFVAPALLLAGGVGLLKEKRWARYVLIPYAFLELAGSLAILVHGFAWRRYALPDWTATQHAMSVVSGITNAMLHSLIPAAVILFFIRPGLLPYASSPDSAFQVLPAAERVAAVVPAKP